MDSTSLRSFFSCASVMGASSASLPPKPLKHKRQYAKGMTLCIAAVCRESGSPRLVLCSDTKASYGVLGSRNSTVKVDVLGRGWAVQLAGNIASARDVIDELKSDFSSPTFSLTTRFQVVTAVHQRLTALQVQRPLAGALLLSGFLEQTPIIVSAWDDDQNTIHVDTVETYMAIGEGQDAASVMLNHRNYREALPIQTATYLVYEAKRIAEQVGSVGTGTSVIIWQAPPDPSDPNTKARVVILNANALAVLDGLFRRFGPQPIPTLGQFPRDCFATPSTP